MIRHFGDKTKLVHFAKKKIPLRYGKVKLGHEEHNSNYPGKVSHCIRGSDKVIKNIALDTLVRLS